MAATAAWKEFLAAAIETLTTNFKTGEVLPLILQIAMVHRRCAMAAKLDNTQISLHLQSTCAQ